MKPISIITHATIAGLGVWAGILLAPRIAVTGTASATHRTHDATEPARTDKPAVSAGTRFASDLAAATALDQHSRLRKLLEMIDKVDAASFAEAWRACRSADSELGQLGMNLLVERFANQPMDECRKAMGEREWKEFEGERRVLAARDNPAALSALLTEAADAPGKFAGLKAVLRLMQDEPEKVLAALESVPRGGSADWGRVECIRRISRTDPERALTLAEGLPERHRENALSTILGNLYDRDPAALDAWVATRGQGGGDLYQSALAASETFRERAANDPAGTLAALGNREGPATRQVLGEWAAKDPNALRAWIEAQASNGSINPGRMAGMAISDAVSNATNPDFGALAALANTIPEGEHKASAINRIAPEWASSDPEAALAWINTLPPSKTQRDAQQDMMRGISKDGDAAKLLAFVDRHPELLRQENVQLDYGRMLDRSIPDTLALFQRLPENLRDRQGRWLVHTLAERDMAAARQLAESIPGDRGIEARSDYAESLAKRDPAAAIAYATNLPESDNANQAVLNIARSALRTDEGRAVTPAAAEAFLATIANPSLREQARTDWLVSMSREDPATAMSQLLASPSSSDTKAIANVAGNWATHNPTAAATWAATLPEGEARTEVVKSILRPITTADPIIALEWASSLPDSDRDDAFNSISYDLSRAARTRTDAQRDALITRVKGLNVSEDTRKALLRRLENK